MVQKVPVTKCPHCGGTTIEAAAFEKAGLNDLLTCPSCGRQATKSKFMVELMQHVTKIAEDAFRNVPGFKPKR